MKHYAKEVINPYNNKKEIKIVNAISEIDVSLPEVYLLFVKKMVYLREQILVNIHLK